MNDNELALKIAEITLDAKKASILSDIIKIGIPSLVAIVSSIIAYMISIKSSKASLEVAKLHKSFDEQIEKLKYDHEKKKSVSERRTKLIEDMTEHVSIIHDSCNSYLRTIRGKLYLIATKQPVSPFLEERVLSKYNSAGLMLNEHQHKAEMLAQLIGKEEVVNDFIIFRQATNDTLADYGYDCSKDLNDLKDYEKNLKKISQKLFNTLSNLYLNFE